MPVQTQSFIHRKQQSVSNKIVDQIRKNAAGIDVGSKSIFVAVPDDRDSSPVREFGTFTKDIQALGKWLKKCGIETVAMESTGVYWIPIYDMLEQMEFDVWLVDPRQVKNVSGRKTDIKDSQWIMQLHSYGLLTRAFRPDSVILELRTYVRQRDDLVRQAGEEIQRMQKNLTQMNVHLHNVINDISGITGMAIVRAIVQGERDLDVLARLRDPRCKSSEEVIKNSLQGNFKPEYVYNLEVAVKKYDFLNSLIEDCETKILKALQKCPSKKIENEAIPEKESEIIPKPLPYKLKKKKSERALIYENELLRITGVNLLEVPGVNVQTALGFIAEVGIDMTKWETAKNFTSWLGLAPNNKVSGGKILSSRTKRTGSPASIKLRMSANSLYRSNCWLGSFLRRMKAKAGAPQGITAAARKQAVLLYTMLKTGKAYEEAGGDYYEKQHKEKMLKNLVAKASQMGYELVPKPDPFAPYMPQNNPPN
jgi:transposase